MARRALAELAVLTALSVGQPSWAGEKVSVTGEVIDSFCYITMGAKGESHRECTQKCADAGIPLALLEDGSNKVIWLFANEDMKTPSAMLRPHAGRKVVIEGEYAERGGTKILLVDSVKAASPKS